MSVSAGYDAARLIQGDNPGEGEGVEGGQALSHEPKPAVRELILNSMKISVILLVSFVLLVPAGISAKTTIDQSGISANITTTGFADMEKLIQDTADFLGPGVANGFAISNIGGYPIGKSYLGDFPHFFIGASASVGLTNMDYFDKDKERVNGRYPGGGVNTSAYFGAGLGKGLDFMGRIFTFSTGMYQPPLKNDYVKLSKLNLYAAGGKIRYNLVGEKTLLPGLFDFGGITISGGADILKGFIEVTGSLDYKMDAIELNLGPMTKQVNLNFNSQYTSQVSWYVITGTAQVAVYFDFLWLFDFYTGFGVSMNYGKFEMKIRGTGALTTDDADYRTYVDASGGLGTLSLVSDNTYRSDIYIPVYIVGFDVRLMVISLTLETMVNLRNRSDINAQVGARLQF